MTSIKLGNGKLESTAFNSRLQPTQIALGAVENATDKLKLEYGYGTTANNGNVLSQKITVKRPSQSDLVFDQLYTYDSLNRITSAEEKTGTTVNWNQTYLFDRYGNRNFNESLTTTLPKSCVDGGNPVMCGAERNIYNPTLSAANNRMAAGQGWAYDASGNVSTDPEGRTFTYDGENKQIEVKNASNATVGQYFFDGDGKRIKKIVPSTGEVTVFVYDAGAKLIGEYSTIVATTENAKVQYLTNDHLGSPRIKTDKNGSVTSRTDYMPYGEEIIAHGGRTSDEGYVADDVRQGFTGYENDEETELNYAVARMLQKRNGRFNSPDPSLASGRVGLPQSWNRYVYTLNSPLKFVDPYGLYEFGASFDETQKENFRKQMKEFDKRLKQIKKDYGKDSEEYKEAMNSRSAYGCEAGTRGCAEKIGSSQVIVEAGTLPAGVSAMEQRNADDTKAIVTLDGGALSRGGDILGDIAHEGVHAYDDLNYINSNKQIKVSDYESERRGFVVTSVIEEQIASRSSRYGGNQLFTIYDQNWKTIDPKKRPSENVRNERNRQIDALLAVPKTESGRGYGLTKDNPGNSYFP